VNLFVGGVEIVERVALLAKIFIHEIEDNMRMI